MNIFLDTTTLYTDPFLNNREIKILINLANEGYIKIFVSEIVCFELAKNTKQNQNILKKELIKKIYEFNKISLQKIDIPKIELPDNILDLLNNHLRSNNISIIGSDYNVITRETLNKYLNNKKPFDFSKDSFRDSLIWLTYVEYINKNSLNDNYFVSDNTKDFVDKTTLQLHSDLKDDCKNIIYIRSLAELLKVDNIISIIEKFEFTKKFSVLKEWFMNNVKIEDLQELFYTKFSDDVNYEIFNYCSNLDASEYSDFSYNGYIDNDIGFDIQEFKILNIDFLSKIYILGECMLSFNADIYEKTHDPDPDEDDFFLVESLNLEKKCNFSIVINENHQYDYFAIKFVGEEDTN